MPPTFMIEKPDTANRILDIQKQEQRAKAEGREFRTDELAADLWDSLPDEDKQPLAQWVADQASGGAPVNMPDGDPSLPDVTDFLDPNTVFFRQPKAAKAAPHALHLPSRAHAEIVYLLARHSLHGSLPLPATADAARALHKKLVARLAWLAAKANELARSRTGDAKRAADLARLLEFWVIHGRPRREPTVQGPPPTPS